MITDRDFSKSLEAERPPTALTQALRGLWYVEKGEWNQARGIVENEQCANAAWVAGHLHRSLGDTNAARSWYIKAERSAPNTPPELERSLITRVLLANMNQSQAA